MNDPSQSPGSAARLIPRMRGRRVLVLGDAMLDRYVWGKASRVSPEAPVLVVEAERETERLGGAANVAWNLTALGAEAVLVAGVGTDSHALALRAALGQHGIQDQGLFPRPQLPTTVKTRIVAHQQHVLRLDQERREDLDAGETARLLETLLPRLESVEAVVISDYGKGMITGALLEGFLPECHRRGMPVCVDPKERHVNLYQGVSTLTPNTAEAGEVVGTRIRSQAELLEVGWKILGATGARSVLITRGPDGMSLFEPPDRVTHIPTVARHVFDVTGAGDTVVACFALALCAGGSLLEAAHVANHAAGLVIREVGTAVPDPGELARSLEEHGVPGKA